MVPFLTSKLHLRPNLRRESSSFRRKFKPKNLWSSVQLIWWSWISSASKIGVSFFKKYTLTPGSNSNITEEVLTKTCYLMHALHLQWWLRPFLDNCKNKVFSLCRSKTTYSFALIFWYWLKMLQLKTFQKK